ncbi:MAG: SDR family oxidoreductase [Chitinophagales bacterium]|nr:SDR family oxidoreductase [Chitinophagales bacterium]
MSNFLIIGGSSGIGFSLTQKMISENQKPIVIARQQRELNTEQVDFFTADVLNDSLPDINSPINGLAYCPGSITLKPFRSLKEEDILSDFRINVLGAVKAIQKYLPNLKQAQSASIVLFSTVAVETGMNFHSSIAIAKGGVEGLMRSLAAELAPAIRVNCIALSLTQTPLASRLIDSEQKLAASKERHPLKTIGEADDVASLAYWLLSDQSKFVTGQVFKMDGGMSGIK